MHVLPVSLFLCSLLTVDCGLYMPPFKSVNVYFMKSIMNMERKAIKKNAVKYIFAPQYDTLSIEKILEFANQYGEFVRHLPDPRDIHMLPRQVSDDRRASLNSIVSDHVVFGQWLLNVAYTVIGADFAEWIRARVDSRNESLTNRHDLNIAIDPEILSVIRASSAVATQTGSSAHLLKVGSKRRRTKQEIEEHNALQERQLQAILEKDERIEQLELQLTRSKSKLETAERAEHLMGQMMDQGVLVQQDDGTYTIKQE